MRKIIVAFFILAAVKVQSQNVGIGTASPQAKLHITGNSSNQTPALWLQSADAFDYTSIKMSSPSAPGKYWLIKSGIKPDINDPNNLLYFFRVTDSVTGVGIPSIVINNIGNVGIGTFAPVAPLSLPPSLGKKISLYPGPTGDVGFAVFGNELRQYIDDANGNITFGFDNYTNGFTERMRIKGNGNIGIGNINPGFSLDVSSRMRIRGGADLNNSAGFWLGGVGSESETNKAFIGMRNDSLVGLYGSQSNWSFRMNTRTGHIGIGDINPNAPLQFDNSVGNRKLVLYETANNNHQFYGFGVTSSVLRYQTATTGDDHVFYAGTGTGSSNELIRMKGNGYMGIGVADPVFRLDVKDRMRIRSGGDNSTSAGINFNNNTNSLAAFVGMQADNQVGFFGHNGAGWGLTMNTQNGALSVGNSTGSAGQVLTSNGSAASPGWTAAGNIIKTGFAGVLTTPYTISGADFIELTNSAYTVTLNSPSRVMLFCKSRTYSTSTGLPFPVDYESRWRLEVWLNGTVSRTYNIDGYNRTGLSFEDNKLDLTTGPEFFDLPAGTHQFTFFATNIFGASWVFMQAVAMIIPQ